MPLHTIDLSSLEGESLREQVITAREVPVSVMRARLLRLALKGVNATRAALATGYSPQSVRNVYRDPTFQAEVRKRVDLTFQDIDVAYIKREKSLHEKISEKANDAFEVLCELLDSEQTLPGHKIKIATEILNRREDTAAFSPRSTTLDVEKLRVAAAAARDMDNVVPIRKEA